MMRHDTCTDEARCQDWPLCRHRGFPLDEGDTGAAISSKPYREAIGSFVGTVIALSATERERDELRAENKRLARRYELASDKAADLRAEVARLRAELESAHAKQVIPPSLQPRLPDPSRPCECGCHPSQNHQCRTHAFIDRILRRHPKEGS